MCCLGQALVDKSFFLCAVRKAQICVSSCKARPAQSGDESDRRGVDVCVGWTL